MQMFVNRCRAYSYTHPAELRPILLHFHAMHQREIRFHHLPSQCLYLCVQGRQWNSVAHYRRLLVTM